MLLVVSDTNGVAWDATLAAVPRLSAEGREMLARQIAWLVPMEMLGLLLGELEGPVTKLQTEFYIRPACYFHRHKSVG